MIVALVGRKSMSAIAVILLLVSVGCNPSSTPAGSTTAPADTTVTLAIAGEGSSLASWNVFFDQSGGVVLRNIEESLVTYDRTSHQLVGELATSWALINPTTWQFKLRPGVKFHDGSPFNAAAAAYDLNFTFSKANAFPIRNRLGPELRAEAVDDLTLNVITEAPDPLLPRRLFVMVFHSMKALVDEPKSYDLVPVGTGPYIFKEWVKGAYITLDANPNWWGLNDSAGRGRPTIKHIKIIVRPDEQVRAAVVKTNEAQLALGLSRLSCATPSSCVQGPTIQTLVMRTDLANPGLADARVRKAMALAIDKQSILTNIMGGGELAGELVAPGAIGYDASLQPYPFDPVQARTLLAAARAAGVKVPVLDLVVQEGGNVPRPQETAEALGGMLRDAGFEAKARTLGGSEFVKLLANPTGGPIDPSRAFIGVTASGNDVGDFGATYTRYYKCKAPLSTYCNPDIDSLWNAASTMSGSDRDAALKEIAKRVHDDYVYVPVGRLPGYSAVAPQLSWEPRLDQLVLVKEMTLR